MFLFKQDLRNLRPENFDVNTPNRSFIRMYAILKGMGVKNNAFFLTLNDTDLLGVDPHNLKDDSKELKMRISFEAKTNPWYTLREIIRVPAIGGSVPFRLSRANLALCWAFFNHIDIMLVMPRQLGKSIASCSIFDMLIYVMGLNTAAAMLANSDKLRRENVNRVKDLRDGMPPWMIYKRVEDRNNSEGLSYSALNNRYLTFVAQPSKGGADSLGRGMTIPIQHWDEFAYFSNVDITYPVALNSTTAAIESARESGELYGNMLTTTAGKLNTKSGKYAHGLMCSSMLFSEHLYDTQDQVTLDKLVHENSKQGMLYAEFNYKQLGKSDEWFQKVANRSGGDKLSVANELLNIWTRGGGSEDAVDHETLELLFKSKRSPKYTQNIDGFIVRWYIDKSIVEGDGINQIPILLGMDPSEAIGRDATALVFMDARSMEVIGACACNTVNIIRIGLFIFNFLKSPNYLFVPERNSTGVTIIDTLLLEMEKVNINPYRRIYNDIIQDRERFKNTDISRVSTVNSNRKHFGFRTTGSSKVGRDFLYNTVFFKALSHGSERIYDGTLINEISGLVSKNGRIDHQSDGHDDHVIAYILDAYVLFYGKNLHLYDFLLGKPELLLKDIRNDLKPVAGVGSSVKSVLEEIEELRGMIKHSRDTASRIGYKHRLKILEDSISDEDSTTIIDDVISISELKKTKKVAKSYNNTDVLSFFR